MSTSNSIRRAVRYALLTSAAAAVSAPVSVSVYAQDQTIQEVVVTGTRISSPNLQSISPVAAITSEDLGMSGKVRIEDIVNQMPQAFAAQGSAISNGSDGTATVSLRGLGDERTLVLVNGRRLMPGDPDGGNAADLNFIPTPLVQRVDVLTGGASSVYGADAVAGVVNFIMDTEFEGVKIEANYSFNQHENENSVGDIVAARGFQTPDSSVSNGYTQDFTFALGIGGPDQAGHATFYAGYREVDPVLQADFDYSACAFNSGSVFTCGGSGTTSPAHFFTSLPSTTTCPGAGCIIGTGNALRPYSGATDAYNFGPLNYFQRPDERYTAGVFANYDVSEEMEVYGEVMFMDDRSVAQIAPSGAFFPSVQLNCDNPFLSPSMVQEFCTAGGLGLDDFTTVYPGRRNIEGGGRQDDIGHEAYRIVAGFRGDITPDWNFDAYFQHGKTQRSSTYLNDFSIVRLGRALQVRVDDRVDEAGQPVNPATFGTPQCISFIDGSDPNCAPWNIFQLGGVNPQALGYLQTPGLIRADHIQRVANANVTGDLTNLIKLPTAETGLNINVGVEWREEETEFRPDTAFATGDLAGQGGATLPTEGRFDVKEVFMEARLPLFEGKTGAESVSIEGGYRYSDYSIGFETDTYKVGADWAPIEAVRLRGSFQRAVRAPSVGELFSPATVLLDGTTDPCDGTPGDELNDGPSAPLEQCLLTGMTAEQYGNVPENPASQYNGLLGGNRNVQPEESDTVSFGVVFQPGFAPGLQVSIDYFDIEVNDAISDLQGGNADAYINQCLTTGDPIFCNRIHRDALGTLWISPTAYIEDTSENIGFFAVEGFDIQANYTLELGEHRLGFNLIGTKMEKAETELVKGLGAFDCLGLYGGTCGVPTPEWRHSFRTNWATPWAGLDVSLTWRYFDEVELETSSSNPQLAGPVPLSDAVLGSRSYIDLTAAMTFFENYTLRLGANNLLDKDPPLTGQANCPAGPCNGNTWSQAYDSIGRQLFATLTINF
jgi:iron complex outermembrane recepter protein